jgi:hypothetical protein
MTAVFTYGFDAARKAFDAAKVKLFTLTNYSILLDQRCVAITSATRTCCH